MKIRTTVISLLALLFAVLIVLEITIQQQILLPSFAELERDDAKTSIKRIDFALRTALDTLEMTAADWGNWAEVYTFVEAPTPQFVATNITPIAYKQLKVNAIIIIDMNGRVVLSAAKDLDTGAALPLQLIPAQDFGSGFAWRRNVAKGAVAEGFVRTNHGIMMVAGAPILDGSGTGTARGMVIMGKLLTPLQVHLIGTQAQADLSLSSDRRSIGDRFVESPSTTRGSRLLYDINGNALASLRVDLPRKITDRGRTAVTYASAYLVIACIAALVLLVVVLNRVVLGPLNQVTRHAVTLGRHEDLTARLDLHGRDEVSVLAREFDRMVGQLGESRRRLVDQSFQAGFAELAKGVLHNLGNAMTPLGVRLAKLEGRLRGAGIGDLEFALAELAGETPGTARHADLGEFARLACREFAQTLREAQADVAVIQRQTNVVQNALAELMRSTRNDHVVEAVRLPELVSQTLEIVPDGCRQRLVVEADDSLLGVGVVQVARTVLRLVLQNLIINAADAVHEAGRDKGVFRVAAEILDDQGRRQLHLRCEDDGVGIDQANLERVFEQGFSTKSKETNYGIGLHWCANAVAALGGRIWAASEGRGRGAAMHVLLPLTT